MNTMIWAGLGVAVGILAPLLFRLWQRSASPDDLEEAPTAGPVRRPAPPPPPAGPGARRPPAGRKFHGVTVKPCPDACPAVLAIADRRFLPEEVPPLPLPGCDQRACRCAYTHHGDRRDAEDRRSGWGSFGGFAPSIPGGNRRSRDRDRRARRKAGPAT
jgi:hypothetical protein